MRLTVAHAPVAAYVSLAASMAIVGGYVGLSKLLVVVFPVFLLAWLRFGIAALAMAGWVRRRDGDAPLSRRDHRLLFWQSFFGNFLFSICMLFGVALTSALAAGVIMSTIPAAVALLSHWLLGERIGWRTAAGIALAVVGIAVLSAARASDTEAGTTDGSAAWKPLLGSLLLLAAVFCEATYVVLGKRLTGTVSPRRISALVNLWGMALATPLGLWAAWQFDFAAVDASAWALLVAYALAASMITVWLWMYGLRQVSASQAGVFTVMLPIGAAGVGVLWLGEPAGAPHLLALGLALAGLVLASWPRT